MQVHLVRDVGVDDDPDAVALRHVEPGRSLHGAVPIRHLDRRPRRLRLGLGDGLSVVGDGVGVVGDCVDGVGLALGRVVGPEEDEQDQQGHHGPRIAHRTHGFTRRGYLSLRRAVVSWLRRPAAPLR